MNHKRYLLDKVKMLCLSLLLLTCSVRGAQCNATSSEAQAGNDIHISHATYNLGMINDQIVTTDAIYLSMAHGYRLKIYWNSSFAWAVDYGIYGYTMVLSQDSSFLIAGS